MRPLLALLTALTVTPPLLAAPPVKGPPPRVMLVGWDGADWSLLDPLLKEGKLPNLAGLLARGRGYELATYEPMASPLIWTTIATGRTPVDHGVTDFQEVDPKSRVRLPISGRSRKVPALWNLASARGVSVGVVGWWATWPAEKVKGFLVSDRASPVLFDAETMSRSPALTWPEGFAEGVRIVGRREGTPGYEDVARLVNVSRAEFDAAVRQNKALGDPITGAQKILGATRVYARTALELYEREKPQLLMLYIQGTDEIGHLLAKYHPPKLQGVADEEFRKFSGGVAAFYQEADRMLGDLVKLAQRDGATLLLVSDHGFRWGGDRPALSSLDFSTAFLWHKSPGILVAAGPGMTPSTQRGKASVFDVAPTVCRLLGLPADPAFEGKPVAGLDARALPAAPPPVAWAKAATVERLTVSADAAADKSASDEFTKKLISLGYLTGKEAAAVDARPPDRAGTETVGSFANVGTFLRVRGKAAEALPWYKKALEVQPDHAPTWMNLSWALWSLKRDAESDDALLNALKHRYSDPETAVNRRLQAYNDRGTDPRVRRQRAEFLGKVTQVVPDDRYRAMYGRMLFELKDCGNAERILGDVAGRLGMPEVFNMHALAAMCLGKTEVARASFQRSLQLNPDQPLIKKTLSDITQGGRPVR